MLISWSRHTFQESFGSGPNCPFDYLPPLRPVLPSHIRSCFQRLLLGWKLNPHCISFHGGIHPEGYSFCEWVYGTRYRWQTKVGRYWPWVCMYETTRTSRNMHCSLPAREGFAMLSCCPCALVSWDWLSAWLVDFFWSEVAANRCQRGWCKKSIPKTSLEISSGQEQRGRAHGEDCCATHLHLINLLLNPAIPEKRILDKHGEKYQHPDGQACIDCIVALLPLGMMELA